MTIVIDKRTVQLILERMEVADSHLASLLTRHIEARIKWQILKKGLRR